MPETCENWLGHVNSRIYYAHQTHESYQELPYSVDFKAPRETWIVRGAQNHHRHFLVVASLSGLMPTRAAMPPTALAARITQKSQLTTVQSLSYPTH